MQINRTGNIPLFKRLMRRTWELPDDVPSGQQSFLSQHKYRRIKWILKYAKRRIFCFAFAELFGLVLERSSIDLSDRRILWINWAAPSLGDSLMDLSARVMLADREVVLLTHPKNVQLYIDDPYYSAVYSNPKQMMRKCNLRFDLVICDAFSPRVLWRKALIAPLTPFVGLYGYLNGFEVHRTYFAFARMGQLISRSSTEYAARPFLSVCRHHEEPVFDVSIAIGGEWEFRTYLNWMAIASWLVNSGFSVCLVGSANGDTLAQEIINYEPNVHSTVGKLDLRGVAREIGRSRIFIGADGGLWHIACALNVPSVVLFADCDLFDQAGRRVTRETSDIICEVLYADLSVAEIAVEDIIDAFYRLNARLGIKGGRA